ncbi:SdiA-regulated domain-containing protein, partial [Porticoccus sp.]
MCFSLAMGSVILLVLFETQGTSAYPTAALDELALDRYQLHGVPTALEGIADNASGLTYNPETDSLFAVTNNPEQLFELNLAGQVLRKIPLHGFEDTEDVTYVGNGQLAILEERRRTIVMVDIRPDTMSLTLENQRQFRMPGDDSENNGFEGLTINPATKQLYIVNEKNPRQLWLIDGFAANTGSISISSPLDLEQNSYGNKD